MAIFKGAGVAIVTPMYEMARLIMINWRNFWSIRLQTVQMRSLSAEQQENHQR